MLVKVFRDVFHGHIKARHAAHLANQFCPICKADAKFYDAVDFNKSCEGEKAGLPLAGERVEYFLCSACGFCFAPTMHAWDLEEFKHRIYNQDYIRVDPEYKEARPLRNVAWLETNLGYCKYRISHLDFGGGDGFLSRKLRENDWRSVSYDPVVDTETELSKLGKHELVTAFEVFEHVPNVDVLMTALRMLIKEDGLILLSTWISDGYIHRDTRLDWVYAAPRNGHISLFSSKSLSLLLQRYGFQLKNLSPFVHLAYIRWPKWISRDL